MKSDKKIKKNFYEIRISTFFLTLYNIGKLFFEFGSCVEALHFMHFN
jgi:hypothetical protein